MSGGRPFRPPGKQAAPSPRPAKERPLVQRQRRAGRPGRRPNTAALSHLAALGRAARGSREPSVRKPNSVPRPPRPRRAALFRHPTSTPHTSKITPPNYTLALSRRLLQPRQPAYGLSPLLGPPACPPAPSFTPGPRLPPHPRSPPPRPWVPSTAPPVRHPLSLRTSLSPVSPISFVPQSLYLSVPVSPHLCVPWTLSGFPPPSPPPHPLPSVFPPQPSFSLIPQSPSLFPSKSLRLPTRPVPPQTPRFPSPEVPFVPGFPPRPPPPSPGSGAPPAGLPASVSFPSRLLPPPAALPRGRMCAGRAKAVAAGREDPSSNPGGLGPQPCDAQDEAWAGRRGHRSSGAP